MVIIEFHNLLSSVTIALPTNQIHENFKSQV